MSYIALIYAGAFSLLLTSCARDDRSVASKGDFQQIPLNQVWAFDMPGTHDVRELEPEKFGERTRNLPSSDRFRLLDESMTYKIRAALKRDHPAKGSTAQAGFAVLGTGREALEGAYDVLANNKKLDASFPLDSNVTLVFFSHFCGQYVHLDRIERHGNNFDVGYQFVPHLTREMTWHIALVPVGKLPNGKYQVNITQIPGGNDKTGHLVGGLPNVEALGIVCRPFSFSVVDPNDKR